MGKEQNVHMVLSRSAVGFALHTTTASTGGIRESVKIAGRDIAYTDVANHNVKTVEQDIVFTDVGNHSVKTVAQESASIRGGGAIAKTVQNAQHTSVIHGCFCQTEAHPDTHGSK